MQILCQEGFDVAESRILHRVCELVNDQMPLVPVVVANENAVTQREADGTR